MPCRSKYKLEPVKNGWVVGKKAYIGYARSAVIKKLREDLKYI
jgi:hypothetical protein